MLSRTATASSRTCSAAGRSAARSPRVRQPGSGGDVGSGLLNTLTATLDRNRDGSMLDDVMGMVGRVLQK